MITSFIIFILSILLFPILLALLFIALVFSMLARRRRQTNFPKQKPKGTIEILPPEEGYPTDDRKDKFRKL